MGNVEEYFDPRTKPGSGRVLARRGRAGEERDRFQQPSRFCATETDVTIARLGRLLESPVREEILGQIRPGPATQHFELAVLGTRGIDLDRKSTRLNSSHMSESRMPSSA